MYRYLTAALLATVIPSSFGYNLVREHAGQNFFDGWNFYGGWDNLTNSQVWWLNEETATSAKLAYINDAGHAIMKVDNTSVLTQGQKRSTIRIESENLYDLGSVWVVDMVHMPFGCSVWPAFWTKGPVWPNNGEIDILEAINLMTSNQMALHTTQGCTHPAPPTGAQTSHNGGQDCGTGDGCTVQETADNSYGTGFNNAGGGVWATQFDASGIFIWFWSRPNVPQNLQGATSSTLDISSWGPPSASYASSANCNVTEYFSPQQLIFDIALCGDWAGVDSIYRSQCGSAGPTGDCYQDMVLGPGSGKYDEAYFEVSYVRAYTDGTPTPTATPQTTVTSTALATTTPSIAVNQNTASSAGVESSPLLFTNMVVLAAGFAAAFYTLTLV
ncbi:hypothetical protein EIP91_007862 [Steccherinum ochraceum]|uniref:GH16 domain-containing protein n=1 Tax=Steccherinum ochraceum TaxID=92696 RepID=A0A4V2MVC4_9APHY|nr:hypothetical protein EIP91_007862 [Steccherinum ochraceum]